MGFPCKTIPQPFVFSFNRLLYVIRPREKIGNPKIVSHFFMEGQAPYLKLSWGLGDGLGGGVEGVNRRDRRPPPLHRKQVIG
jgi:hypothetical protein